MSPSDRFWSKVYRGPACWIWLAASNSSGRGLFFFEGRMQQVHRVSWKMNRGPIPNGLQVLHTCDIGLCVRPKHLFLGTQKDNIDDMFEKGRNPIKVHDGELNPNSRVTEIIVREIRALSEDGYTRKELQALANLSKSQIARIVRGEHWSRI